MNIKCPGQDKQFWKPDDIFEVRCPRCKAGLEFFKDESKKKCLKCKKEVLNPRMNLGCAKWCPQAKECLGL